MVTSSSSLTGKPAEGKNKTGEWVVPPAYQFVPYRVPALTIDPKVSGWYRIHVGLYQDTTDQYIRPQLWGKLSGEPYPEYLRPPETSGGKIAEYLPTEQPQISNRQADMLVRNERGELHHAILCHGPNAATLREVAMRIAKTLNCLNGTEGDDCTACTRIERRMHPDVHFIEVIGERLRTVTDDVRSFIAGAEQADDMTLLALRRTTAAMIPFPTTSSADG